MQESNKSLCRDDIHGARSKDIDKREHEANICFTFLSCALGWESIGNNSNFFLLEIVCVYLTLQMQFAPRFQQNPK